MFDIKLKKKVFSIFSDFHNLSQTWESFLPVRTKRSMCQGSTFRHFLKSAATKAMQFRSEQLQAHQNYHGLNFPLHWGEMKYDLSTFVFPTKTMFMRCSIPFAISNTAAQGTIMCDLKHEFQTGHTKIYCHKYNILPDENYHYITCSRKY